MPFTPVPKATLDAAIAAADDSHTRAGAGDRSVTVGESAALVDLYAAIKAAGARDPLDELILLVTRRPGLGVDPYRTSERVYLHPLP